jgi:hypothetical protein
LVWPERKPWIADPWQQHIAMPADAIFAFALVPLVATACCITLLLQYLWRCAAFPSVICFAFAFT